MHVEVAKQSTFCTYALFTVDKYPAVTSNQFYILCNVKMPKLHLLVCCKEIVYCSFKFVICKCKYQTFCILTDWYSRGFPMLKFVESDGVLWLVAGLCNQTKLPRIFKHHFMKF